MRDNVPEWPSTTQRCSAIRALAVLVCTLAVAGCASLSESECRGGDWYAIGIEDGAGGANAARLATHRDACAKYAVEDDLRTYQGQLSVENDDQQRQRLVSVMRQLQIDRWRLESERRDLDWQFERL